MFDKDYIIPGDIFSDETTLCMQCGAKIAAMTYKEMPKINSPKETVNVACKTRYHNFRMVPVVIYRRGQEAITNLNVCSDCSKTIVPEEWSDQIIKQIVRAYQIEAKWAGLPEAAVQAIIRQFADARIVRKLNKDEIIAGKILEVSI